LGTPVKAARITIPTMVVLTPHALLKKN
jgi:hypothetical protein